MRASVGVLCFDFPLQLRWVLVGRVLADDDDDSVVAVVVVVIASKRDCDSNFNSATQ